MESSSLNDPDAHLGDPVCLRRDLVYPRKAMDEPLIGIVVIGVLKSCVALKACARYNHPLYLRLILKRWMRKAQAAIHHLVHTACHDHFVLLIGSFGVLNIRVWTGCHFKFLDFLSIYPIK